MYVEIFNQNEGISLFDDLKTHGPVLTLLHNPDIDFALIVVNNQRNKIEWIDIVRWYFSGAL